AALPEKEPCVCRELWCSSSRRWGCAKGYCETSIPIRPSQIIYSQSWGRFCTKHLLVVSCSAVCAIHGQRPQSSLSSFLNESIAYLGRSNEVICRDGRGGSAWCSGSGLQLQSSRG